MAPLWLIATLIAAPAAAAEPDDAFAWHWQAWEGLWDLEVGPCFEEESSGGLSFVATVGEPGDSVSLEAYTGTVNPCVEQRLGSVVWPNTTVPRTVAIDIQGIGSTRWVVPGVLLDAPAAGDGSSAEHDGPAPRSSALGPFVAQLADLRPTIEPYRRDRQNRQVEVYVSVAAEALRSSLPAATACLGALPGDHPVVDRSWLVEFTVGREGTLEVTQSTAGRTGTSGDSHPDRTDGAGSARLAARCVEGAFSAVVLPRPPGPLALAASIAHQPAGTAPDSATGLRRDRLITPAHVPGPGFGPEQIARSQGRVNLVVSRCYTRELEVQTQLSNQLRIEALIDATGRPRDVRSRGATSNDRDLVACAVKVIQELRFDRLATGGFKSLTFRFNFDSTERPPEPVIRVPSRW